MQARLKKALIVCSGLAVCLRGISRIICQLSTGFNRRYLFWGAISMLWLYLNVVFLQLLSVPVPSEDTGSYLCWSLFRTIGYPALLDFYSWFFESWTYLHIFQLNFLLAGLFGLSFAIIRISGSYAIGWFFLAFILSAGNMLLSAADMMTESIFSGLVMMHLAFMYLFLMDGRRFLGLFAGMALAAAILCKSVAATFLGPLFLFFLFTPIARRGMLILILPAFIAWLGPSAYNYTRNGVFESSIAGGYALAGHVAWGIHPYPGSAYPELAKVLEDRLAPTLAKRPSKFNSVAEYGAYTNAEVNTLLWGNIVPVMIGLYANCPPMSDARTCTWKDCVQKCGLVDSGKVLQQLSFEAIANNPAEYAYQVWANYNVMWDYSFRDRKDFLSGANSRAEFTPSVVPGNLVNFPLSKTPSVREAILSRIQDTPGKKVIDFLSMSDFFSYVNITIDRYSRLVLIISLIASSLVFRLRIMSPAAKTFCYTALLVNAYFLGTALAASALPRYAYPMQGAVAALIFLGLVLVIKRGGCLIKAGKNLIYKSK